MSSKWQRFKHYLSHLRATKKFSVTVANYRSYCDECGRQVEGKNCATVS